MGRKHCTFFLDAQTIGKKMYRKTFSNVVCTIYCRDDDEMIHWKLARQPANLLQRVRRCFYLLTWIKYNEKVNPFAQNLHLC